MSKNIGAIKLEISETVMKNWQDIVDLLAELAIVPAGFIMRIVEEDIEVLVSSASVGNPYEPGAKEHLPGSGLYCETVVKTQQKLLVPNALTDPAWKNNPDVKLDMISYLGFPICFPDKTPFGTICILDSKSNSYSETIERLILKFRNMIENQLEFLYMNAVLGEKYERLVDYLDELNALRGLIPICASCKKVKDDRGYWNAVEKYIFKHPEANFTHSYCPDCYQKAINKIDKYLEQS